MATLTSICYKPEGVAVPREGYLRQSVAEAQLVVDYGIQGDRKGGNPKRQLNVMDTFTLAELESEGFDTAPGALGENLVIDGLDLRTVPPGSALRIGAQAVITLDKLRAGCEKLHAIDGRMPTLVDGRIGAICSVVRAGTIRVGDEVFVTVTTE